MIRRMAGVAIILMMAGTESIAQPCNPVIDGTYCASQPSRTGAGPSRTTLRGDSLTPIKGLGGDLTGPRDADPATLGAITFRSDGAACIGLLRRGNCK